MLEEIAGYAAEEWAVRQGWKAIQNAGSVSFVRDGFVRVIVSRIGGDEFVIAWEYGMGIGEAGKDWRVERYDIEEIGMQAHMTLNAMWV